MGKKAAGGGAPDSKSKHGTKGEKAQARASVDSSGITAVKIAGGLVVGFAVILAVFFRTGGPDTIPTDLKSAVTEDAAAAGAAAGVAEDAQMEALDVEMEARIMLLQGYVDESRSLFEQALGLAESVPNDKESDVVSSAHMHLGTIFGEQRFFDECIAHHEAAHKDPRVRSGALLRERPHPFDMNSLDTVIRMHLGMYKYCLHAKLRDDEGHEVFKDALAHKHWRHEWQCASGLSPVSWNLRAQAWWELSDAANGAEELNKALEKYRKKLRKESDDFFSHVDGPEGAHGVPLNEELSVNGTKPWLELLLWDRGQEQQHECSAVPKMCKLLRKFKSRLHPSGQVKLSCMTGGTTATRHCGPCDTKLRFHHAILLPEFRKAEISVADTTKHWVEGRSLLFDDSFEHTVDFDADPGAKRVVLIVDLVHPDVPKKAVPSLPCR